MVGASNTMTPSPVLIQRVPLVRRRALGELAVVSGQMKVELHRSGIGAGIGADQLTLIITLPNGREFGAHASRDELKDIADEAFDE
jgi:hypothetical protein